MTESRDLALQGGQMNASKPSEICSARLWKLASDFAEGDDRRNKILAISRSDVLRSEAAQVVPHLEKMLQRVSNDQIFLALQPLLLVKKQPDFGEGDVAQQMHTAWLNIYYEQLRRFPLYAIKAGVNQVIGTHVFPDMPQPAELVKAVEPFSLKIRTAHYRLKEALRLEEKPPSEIDRAANRQAMIEAGFLDANGRIDVSRIMSANKPMPKAPPRPTETPQQAAERIRKYAK